MAIGLVFIYFSVFLYGGLLVLLTGLAIYAGYRFERRTAYAFLGLVGWLFVAPILGLGLFVVQDVVGLSAFLAQDGNEHGFGLSMLIGYVGSSPLFLMPLARRLLTRHEPAVQPA